MSTETVQPAVPRHRVRQVGTVRSIAGAKSVVVEVDRRVGHARYGKFQGRSSRFMAHDETNQCTLGDVVEIVASRHLSARKCWRVARIVKRGVSTGAEIEA